MKRILPIFSILVLGLGLSACSGDETPTGKANNATSPAPAATSAPAAPPAPAAVPEKAPATSSTSPAVTTSGPSTPAAVSEAQKANEIIKFYNTTLSAFRTGAAPVGQLDHTSALMRGHNATMPVSNFSPTHLALLEQSLDGIFAREDADKLKADFAEYFDLAKNYAENTKAYEAYTKAKDYAKDKWAKGDDLAKQNADLADKLRQKMRDIMQVVQPAAERAEGHLLQGNVIKDHVLLARKYLNEMEATLLPLGDNPPDMGVSKKNYAESEATLAAARALPAPAGEDRASEQYKRFLDAGASLMADVQKEIQAGKTLNAEALNKLESRYQDVVNLYNQFMDGRGATTL